jgi:predicted nucleic acid-binding protein
MDIIVDANILFAALIKNSMTAKLMFVERLHLYAPEYLLDEFKKYRREILNKTHRTDKEFDQILTEISACIQFFPETEFDRFIDEANRISPDPDDAIYFALALKLLMPIWSNDKRLQEQNIIKIFKTSNLLDMFSSDLEQ